MAANSSKSSSAKSKKPPAGSSAAKKSSGAKTSASKGSKAAEARKKAQARAELERQRRRFITALILFALSVLFLFIYFIPGDRLWLIFHQLYRGLFGVFGFAVPAVTLYCCWQNGKDEPSDDFKGKTVCASFLILILSTAVYAFQADSSKLGGYFEEIHQSFINASAHHGTGFIGALLGIPVTKLTGSVGGGIICLFAFLILLAFTFDSLTVALIQAFKRPVRRVGENISDSRQIRTEVRKREQQIKDEKRKQQREEYVRSEIDRRLSSKTKKSGNPEFRKLKRTPFYEPEREDNFLTEPPEEEQPPKKKQRKKSAQSPAPPDEEFAPLPAQPAEEYGSGFDFDQLYIEPEDEPDELPFYPIEEPVPDPLPQPVQPVKPAHPSAGQDNTDKFEIAPDSSFISGHYIKPPFNLLEPQPPEQEANISMELNQSGTMLVDTLKSFGVQTTIVNICRGPSVTRYELQPAAGIKISKITNLSDDIAMSLAATGVRIEAPIPGKSAVGIEVPNKFVSIVKMRNLVESKEFQEAKSNLTVALGKDITGKITLADLSKMPHLLIAGSTGSGKSVCINSMLVSLLYKSSPDEVKLMLIDPKVVELGVYNGIPHLLVPVVTDPRKAAGALSWAVNEMLNRYKIFAEYNVRDMHSYNRFVDRQNAQAEELAANEVHIDEGERSFEEDEMLAQAQAELNSEGTEESGASDEPKKLQKMPQIVIVIDELADLMMAAPKDVEESICRLAQMARAAGMHLVIATQRPSVDVITGLIKANVPSRIAFAVKSQTDSRTILDTGGAEKLLGRGDMLFSPIGTTKPVRVQGCYVDDMEIENIINFIKKNKVVEYDENVLQEIEKNAVPDNNGDGSDNVESDLDPMLEDAIKCVVEAGQASTSMLQRRFRVGYARAGRLIDEMEQMGIVGPHEGSKPRQVLMTYQQWMERSVTHSD